MVLGDLIILFNALIVVFNDLFWFVVVSLILEYIFSVLFNK